MIVPRYWAESRVQHRQAGRQVTVRRYGWSDDSEADAQRLADERAQAALQQILAGEKLPRSEPRRPYNGAQGVPIREEIVDRQGETIITRNAYGARCLNTPNVLFADIDFQEVEEVKKDELLTNDGSTGFVLFVMVLLLVSGAAVGGLTDSVGVAVGGMVAALLFGSGIAHALHRLMHPMPEAEDRRVVRPQVTPEQRALGRMRDFLAAHPAWNLRLYRTPAGLRVMATHQTFHANDPAVRECFRALGTDPIYVAMCLNQQCFRARVTAKPWRIGIDVTPRPGVWPVAPERVAGRSAWIARYEAAAQSFAACALMEEMGSGVTHPDVAQVRDWHDTLCGATRALPLA